MLTCFALICVLTLSLGQRVDRDDANPTPVKDYTKIPNAVFEAVSPFIEHSMSLEECTKECNSNLNCESFVFFNTDICKLYSFTTEDFRLKQEPSADFYQRTFLRKSGGCPLGIINGVRFAGKSGYEVFKNMSIVECVKKCYDSACCSSVNLNLADITCTTITALTASSAPTLVLAASNWQYLQIDTGIPLEFKYINGIAVPKKCPFNCFKVMYYRNETGRSDSKTASFTVGINRFAFMKIKSTQPFVSRISCAASCSLNAGCTAFRFDHVNCKLLRVF